MEVFVSDSENFIKFLIQSRLGSQYPSFTLRMCPIDFTKSSNKIIIIIIKVFNFLTSKISIDFSSDSDFGTKFHSRNKQN